MSKARQLIPADYAALLAEVKERVRSAQYAALRAVNKELVGLYWDIGRLIVERQAGKTWGKAVVERLAGDLQSEFPGTGGFSTSNLWRMKGFFEAHASSAKIAPLVRKIGWSHNFVILEGCADPLGREFYLAYRANANVQPLVAQIGWTQNLKRHASRTGRDRQAAGGNRMSAIEGFCDVRTELADLNKEAVELAAKIQTNLEELGV